MNQKKIGEFIAKLRKENNLTQEELANKLGITKNAVSKWERGISMMDVSLLKPVSELLKISIVELLNGERIKQDDIKNKTEDTIKSTIEYSNNRIKKNRVKNIFFTILIILVLSTCIFFGYKLVLLHKYTLEKPDNVDEVVKGLKNSKEIKVYKRTISESDYFVIENFKIRNDFKDFEFKYKEGENLPGRIYVYNKEENGEKIGINFAIEDEELQLDKQFATKEAIFFGESNLDTNAFNNADRTFFLLKNDINNEVDFYKYIADNYYKENNIFMDKRTMMENYAFNLFVSIAIPRVDEFIIIKGDYTGYIIKLINEDKQLTQVTIIRDDKSYGFITNDPRLKDEDYLIDLIGTIEIR
jgi:transcriptional regulator with XRE-family HTH domain